MSWALVIWALAIGLGNEVVGPRVLLAQPASDPVEEYLTRLGLVDLQLLYLEQQLQQRRPQPETAALARRLADLYAFKLMSVAGDPAAYADVLQQVTKLIERHPAANTKSLQVMLLQADYNRAEQAAVTWLADRSNTEAAAQAKGILSRIAPQLNDFHRELKLIAEDLDDKLNETEREDARALEKEVARMQAVAARSTYFAGWSYYYLGLLKPAAAAKNDFERSTSLFLDLLGLDLAELAEVDAEWLALQSIWRSRAMIGCGLSLAAQDKLADAGLCFKTLRHPSVPPSIVDQAPYWHLQALLNAGHLEQAIRLAEQQLAALSGAPTQGKVSFYAGLVRAAYAEGSIDAAAQAQLQQLGMRGLGKLGRTQEMTQLIKQFKIQVDQSSSFYLQWARGSLIFAEAERSRDEGKYKAASKALAAALERVDADVDVVVAARCRYQLAWCHHRLQRSEQAAREFDAAYSPLKAGDPETAVKSAWMAFVSYEQASQSKPELAAKAISILRRLRQDFPGHELADKAEYNISKIQRRATPEQSLRSLEAIDSSSPNYASARYDICELLYQLWSKARPGGRERADLTGRLQAALDVYRKAAARAADPAKLLRCQLIAADLGLNGEPANLPAATRALDEAEAGIGGLNESSLLMAEYQYRRLQLADRQDKQEDLERSANWLVKNAGGTAYELPALVIAAGRVDSRYKAARPAERALIEHAAEIYGKLVAHFGTSAEVLLKEKNARISLSRHALYLSELGRHEQAVAALEQLLAVFPKERDYLRRAGLARFAAGEHSQALPHWRTLALGVQRSSPEWFEARYYQLACLAQADPAAAKKAWKQFKLLHPKLGPEPWRSKFRQLGARIDS